jgi:hypothetical protein
MRKDAASNVRANVAIRKCESNSLGMIAFTRQRSANPANEKDPKKERTYYERRLNPPRPIFDTPTRLDGVIHRFSLFLSRVNFENLGRCAYEIGAQDLKQQQATGPSWLAFIGVIGISLKLISARSTSIFVTGERSFAYAGVFSKSNKTCWWKSPLKAESARVKYWEIIADNLSKAGWSCGCD